MSIFKKDNNEILGNTVMAPIGDRLNNIYAERFLDWTHEGKTQFRIMPHGFPMHRQGEKKRNSVSPRVFVNGGLYFYVIVLGKEGSSAHW